MSSLPSWRDAKRVSIDVECRDEDLMELGPGVRRDPSRNYVCGIAFAIEDGPAHYLPIRHEGGDNLPEEQVWRYLQDQFAEYSGIVTGCALEYDLDWLWHGGRSDATRVRMPRVSKYVDTQVNDVLIDELRDHYSLNAMCERWGLPPKNEAALTQAASAYRVHPKGGLWRLPARYVGDYGIGDVLRPLQILRRQEVEIAKQELGQICELEHLFTPLCPEMRHRGIRIGMDRVESIEREALEVETEELRKVRHATGVEIAVDDVWTPEVLGRALERCGYSPPCSQKILKKGTVKREYSVDNDFLGQRCGEVGRWLRRAREWNKLRTTFCAQMKKYAIRSGDGEWRIHPTTNQLKSEDDDRLTRGGKKGKSKGVRYGRTSCTDPSVQNQPIRHDEFGLKWRSIFLPDRGARWACSDWAQQEPRIMVSAAEKRGLPGAREFADEYRRNPRLDIHGKLTELSGRPKSDRKIIKNYVNGRLYGMGDAKLCDHLGLPTLPVIGRDGTQLIRDGRPMRKAGPEGQAIIDEFRVFAPWIDDLTRDAAETARRRGHIWTVLRRKCRFPVRTDERGRQVYDYVHKAGNRYGQGSAADQMKATAVAARREGIPIQMIVHDEFNHSFTDIRVARRLKELQENTIKFGVPMLVDLEIGNETDGGSWGELEKDAA